MQITEFSQCNSEKVAETTVSAEPDGRGGDYLPLFAAINAVLGIPERTPRGIPDEKEYRLTENGVLIYGLINRHRRDGLAMPVRTTRDVKDNGRVETRYCLRDVIVLVRRERRVWRWLRPKSHGVEIPPDLAISPDLVARLDADLRDRMDDDPERIDAWERYAIKIPALEKERTELAATRSVTPGDHQYKHRRLADIEREIACLMSAAPTEAAPAAMPSAAPESDAGEDVGKAAERIAEALAAARVKVETQRQVGQASPHLAAQWLAILDACEFLRIDPSCLPEGTKSQIESRVSTTHSREFETKNAFRVAYQKATTLGIVEHWRKDLSAGRTKSEKSGEVATLRNAGRC